MDDLVWILLLIAALSSAGAAVDCDSPSEAVEDSPPAYTTTR